MIPTIVAVLGGSLVTYISLVASMESGVNFILPKSFVPPPYNSIPVLVVLIGVTLLLYILCQYLIVYLGYVSVPLTIYKAGLLLLIASILFALAPFVHSLLPKQEAAGWLLLFTFPIGGVGFVIGLVTLLVGFLKK